MATKTKTAVHSNPLGDQAEFLRLLYQDAKGRPLPGFVELRAINPDGAGVNRDWVQAQGSTELGDKTGLDCAIASIRSLERSCPGWNVYHGVATRARSGDGGKSSLVAAQGR